MTYPKNKIKNPAAVTLGKKRWSGMSVEQISKATEKAREASRATFKARKALKLSTDTPL